MTARSAKLFLADTRKIFKTISKPEGARVESFNPDSFEELKNAINPIILSNNNTRERVREALASFGIKLVYQEKFDKTPVDGYTFWSGENPAIVMTLRHKRIDNFAFTVFHELGHIYLHLINNREARFIDYEPAKQENTTAREGEANEFAKEALIPKEQWEGFLKHPRNSDDDIITFATRNNIHPAIVLGRLQVEQNNYALRSTINKRLQ